MRDARMPALVQSIGVRRGAGPTKGGSIRATAKVTAKSVDAPIAEKNDVDGRRAASPEIILERFDQRVCIRIRSREDKSSRVAQSHDLLEALLDGHASGRRVLRVAQ